LPSTHAKLVRRVKPLYRLSELETSAYAFLRRIDYIVEECPFAKGATSIAHKEILNRMEDASPGAKHNFLFGFLEKGRAAFERAAAGVLMENESRFSQRHDPGGRHARRCHCWSRANRRRKEERQAFTRPPRRSRRARAPGARPPRRRRRLRGRGRHPRVRGPARRAGVQYRAQRRADRGLPGGRVRYD